MSEPSIFEKERETDDRKFTAKARRGKEFILRNTLNSARCAPPRRVFYCALGQLGLIALAPLLCCLITFMASEIIEPTSLRVAGKINVLPAWASLPNSVR